VQRFRKALALVVAGLHVLVIIGVWILAVLLSWPWWLAAAAVLALLIAGSQAVFGVCILGCWEDDLRGSPRREDRLTRMIVKRWGRPALPFITFAALMAIAGLLRVLTHWPF
jgi:hypothetical protein